VGRASHMPGMKPRFVPLAVSALLLAASPAAADLVCHPNQLGSQTCAGTVRPVPRPVIRSDVQALERVTDRHPDPPTGTRFIPAGKRNQLGTTIFESSGPIGTCQPDMLGNLRCR
jgi:hypothetical protein